MTLPQGHTQTQPHQLTADTVKLTEVDPHRQIKLDIKETGPQHSHSHTCDRFLLTGSLIGHTPEQAHLATLATNLAGNPGPEGTPGTWHEHARADPALTLTLTLTLSPGFQFPFPS